MSNIVRRTSRGTLVAGCLVAIFGLSATAHASAAPDTPTADISSVQSSDGRVQFVFSATNLPSGAQLNPTSVQVTADGQTLQATAALSGASSTQAVILPKREVMLVLDTSGSMAGDGIAAARDAAKAYAVSLASDVQLGLVTFSDTPTIVVPPTRNRGLVGPAFDNLAANGNTALFDGIITAVDAMKTAPAGTEKRLVILSDGDDTTSHHSISDAIASLNSADVSADVVAFRIPGNKTTLDQIAASSGGRVLPAGSAAELASAFKTAVQAFKQQVLVTVVVPDALAGKAVTLTTSLNAGAQSLVAQSPITMPGAAPGSTRAGGVAIDKPASTATSHGLWLLLALVFAALVVIALIGLWTPATAKERAEKQSRLNEVSRYRLVETVGRTDTPVQDRPTETGLGKATLSFVDRAVRARGKREGMVDVLDRAGMRIRPEEWAVLQASIIIVFAAVVTLAMRSVFGIFIGGVFGWLLCRTYVRRRIRKRVDQFQEQLPDMLQLVAGSLRSGFSLNQAIAGVVSEGTEPTAGEFARALTEVRLGAGLEDALDSVADRMESLDLHLVVLAVRIARDVGGNLAEVLLTTVGTMRERAQLKGQVRVLSAEGRLSAKILTGLPFLMAGYLLVFRRSYLSPLIHTGQGIALLIIGSVLLVIGSFWLSRLTKIEV